MSRTERLLLAKLASVKELAKLRVNELEIRIKAKKHDILRKQNAIAKTRSVVAKLPAAIAILEEKVESRRDALRRAGPASMSHMLFALKVRLDEFHARRAELRSLRHRVRQLRFDLHQHKRKLAILQHRREQGLCAVTAPSLCFGSAKLFGAQFELEADGLVDHAEWLSAWKGARQSAMTFEGDASRQGGNRFARLKRRGDGLFDLELRLPKAFAHLAERSFSVSGNTIACIDLRALSFKHGHDLIVSALESSRPVTVKFLHDATSW